MTDKAMQRRVPAWAKEETVLVETLVERLKDKEAERAPVPVVRSATNIRGFLGLLTFRGNKG